jgi:hypothetical protein
VTIWTGHGNQTIESTLGVGSHIGVSMLVDENSGGGVRYIQETGTDTDSERGHNALHFIGNVHELGTPTGLDANGLHALFSLVRTGN